MGDTLGSLSGKTFVEVSLKDYRGNPIIPISAKLRRVTYYGIVEFSVTNGAQFIIGHHEGGAVRTDVVITNENIKFVFNPPAYATQIVESIGTIEFLEVVTEDRTYNEFKFA